MYNLFLFYSLTQEKSFQLEISTQSEMQRGMMVQDGCEVLYNSPSKIWLIFTTRVIKGKKKDSWETKTSKISFDSVTECMFNLWINKHVMCDVQFVKNVLFPLAFMLYVWNRCTLFY